MLVAVVGLFEAVGEDSDPRLHIIPERFHETDLSLALGFADAADTLIKRWTTELTPNDLHFAPILLLYRHALELVLKQAISDAANCLRRRGVDVLSEEALGSWMRRNAGHNLQMLANKVAGYLDQLELEGIPSEVADVLREMHELDPTGETFRYAEVWDKSRGATVPASRPEQTHIDIEAMGATFDHAFRLLADGLIPMLDECLSVLNDMARDADGC